MGKFRGLQWVRLHGLERSAVNNGKLGQIKGLVQDNGRYVVELVGENRRQISVKPENMVHACFACHTCSSEVGTTARFCGKCKMASYCNEACQLTDWSRHKGDECGTLKIGRDIVKDPVQRESVKQNTVGAVRTRAKFTGEALPVPVFVTREQAAYMHISISASPWGLDWMRSKGPTFIPTSLPHRCVRPLLLRDSDTVIATFRFTRCY